MKFDLIKANQATLIQVEVGHKTAFSGSAFPVVTYAGEFSLSEKVR